MLKYNHLFITDADLESLLERIDTCHDNPERSSSTKLNKHTPSYYSLFTHCSFNNLNKKLDYYIGRDWGKDCVERFCKDLKEHTMKIINFGKKRNYNVDIWRK